MQCLDFTDKKVALSTIQNIDFVFTKCEDFPEFMGISKGEDYFGFSPEYIAYRDKECGKVPDDFYYDAIYFATRY